MLYRRKPLWQFSQWMMIQRSKPEALYLHVPFCTSICYYCDFTHGIYQSQKADVWLQAIKTEIEKKDINPDLKTIYIGGGTPSALNPAQLDTLLSLLDSYASNVQEYTIEVNPESLTDEKAEIFIRHHINRVSMGFQTSDPMLLKECGRYHTYEDVCHAVTILKYHGITNISLDLMYSLPHQTMASFKKSIDDAIALKPTHLSLYSLTIEENTVFGKRGYQPLDEDTEADMYEYMVSYLPQKGYKQYEVSNFALPGYESKHNQAYWEYRDFYGIGRGASGKEGDIRYDNVRNMNAYLKNPLSRDVIPLTKKDQMFEMLMMGMRLKRGMSLKRFKECFGTSFMDVYGDKAESLKKQGLITWDQDYIRCSDSGYEIMNSVLEEFLD